MDTRGKEVDAFVLRAAPGLLRTARLLVGEVGAEDLVQDVLERVYVAWPRVADPLAYARRALVNSATNRWRSRQRRPEVPLGPEHDRPVADGSDRLGDRDLVARALARLPPGQRAAVVLRHVEDLSEAEAADALGLSVGTVKSQTSRGLARLRAALPELTDTRETP